MILDLILDWKKILLEVLTKVGAIGNNWSGEIRISISDGGIRWIDITERKK